MGRRLHKLYIVWCVIYAMSYIHRPAGRGYMELVGLLYIVRWITYCRTYMHSLNCYGYMSRVGWVHLRINTSLLATRWLWRIWVYFVYSYTDFTYIHTFESCCRRDKIPTLQRQNMVVITPSHMAPIYIYICEVTITMTMRGDEVEEKKKRKKKKRHRQDTHYLCNEIWII